jgi:tyrosine-protein phosphatase YwqE
LISEDPTALADLHSHLIPGVDDGARDLADSRDSVQMLTRSGIRRIITTPHLDGSLTQNPDGFRAHMEVVDAAWESVRVTVAEKFPEVEFRRGHEVMLDVPDPDFSDDRVRLAGTSFVLIEWPRLQVPPGTEQVISRLCAQGLRPIIAHPERYHGMDSEMEIAGKWRDAGAYLQVNHGSLARGYGTRIHERAVELMERGWVDFLSSDFHARPHLVPHVDEARSVLDEMGGDEQFLLLARTNPTRVFRDEAPLPVPPLARRKGAWQKLRDALRGEKRW